MGRNELSRPLWRQASSRTARALLTGIRTAISRLPLFISTCAFVAYLTRIAFSVRRDLSKMHGIQYHISHLSRPPDLWIFDKVRRRRPSTTQQQQTGQVSTLPGSRGRGLEDSQASPELLEVVAIVQGDVSVVRSFEEVVGARLVSSPSRPTMGASMWWRPDR